MIAAAALFLAVMVAVRALRRRDAAKAIRAVSAVLLAAAVCAILLRTLHPYGTSTASVRINLTPGDSIRDLFKADNLDAVQNVCGNVALFAPIGLLGVLSLRWRASAVTAAAAAFSAVIEFAQLSVGGRWVDIDDVLLNSVGACLGAVGAQVAIGTLQRREASRRPDEYRESAR